MQRPAKPFTPVRFRLQPPRAMNKKITVFGLGYVGCSIAVLLSKNNFVTAIDIDHKKVKDINNKKSPIDDKDLNNFLANEKLELQAQSKLDENSESSFYVIATPTDFNEKTNYFDTSSVENVIKLIKDQNKEAFIVIKSTIPIGFTKKINKKYNCDNIVFSPEFLREGSALHDNLYPSRIIIGDKSDKAKEFVDLLCNAALSDSIKTYFTNSDEAECIKLFANTYLALRVAFFNELDTFGYINNLDVKSIISGVCSDTRIGDYYNNPSFGYGGYCLPKDTKQLLANFYNVPQNIISSIEKSNDTRKDFIFNEIKNKNLKNIGIYSLAMKSNSGNHRSSAIIDIIEKLQKENLNIYLYEPSIKNKYFMNTVKVFDSLPLFKTSSDLIITNRSSPELDDVKDKLFTRDIFGNN